MPDSALTLFRIVHFARAAGAAALAQLALHSELIAMEWAEEKARWLKIVLALLSAAVGLFCLLLTSGVCVIAASWNSAYRLLAVGMVLGAYLLIFVTAILAIRSQILRGKDSFIATRAELSADLSMLKSKL